ncbi:wd domain-containing protein, partial [Cystoisospora suis]
MRRLFTARRGRRGIEDEEEEEDFSTRDHEEEEGGEGIRRRNGKREEGFEGSLKNSFSDDEEEDEDVSALWRLPRDKGGGRREEEGDYSHVPCSSCSYEIVQSVSFNQDGSCLSLATNRGFLIYSTEPLLQTFSR